MIEMMQPITLTELKYALDLAILGNLCVQSVPSDYEILYLGFGTQLIEPPTIIGKPGEKAKYISHDKPQYELRTSYSHWWVEKEGKRIGGSEDQTKDEATANSLVGIKAISWEFLIPGWGMRIDFDENLTWHLEPIPDTKGSEIWRLAISHNTILMLTNDGQSYKKHE